MDDVIADHALYERWHESMTIEGLGVVYVPLRPVLHASRARIARGPLRGRVSRLQNGAVVRIAESIITEPDDTYVTIGVGGDPGEDVGVADRRT